MAVAKHKVRKTISIEKVHADRFDALCKHFGMPDTTLSAACNDIIRDLCETFETAKNQGYFTIEDLFKVMGRQMQMHLDEIKEDQNDKKEIHGGEKAKTA